MGSSGAGVTGTYEPDVDVGNLNWGTLEKEQLFFIYMYV